MADKLAPRDSLFEASTTSMHTRAAGKLPVRSPLTLCESHAPCRPGGSASSQPSGPVGRARPSGSGGSAICCALATSDSVCRSRDFALPRGVSRVNLEPGRALECENVQRAVRQEPRSDQQLTRVLSAICDSETHEASEGDLSCRRNKRTRLPRSVRLPYEPRSGGRTW